MKIFARVHSCSDLFDYFLSVLHKEDKKLAYFTQYVFKDFSKDHIDLVKDKYLPAMLLIADSD